MITAATTPSKDAFQRIPDWNISDPRTRDSTKSIVNIARKIAMNKSTSYFFVHI